MSFQDIDSARRLLGLKEYASFEEIKAAYRDMAKKYHPDHCKKKDKKECEEKSKQINNAKDLLMAYCLAYKYSFSESAVRRNSFDAPYYDHLKQFYEDFIGEWNND